MHFTRRGDIFIDETSAADSVLHAPLTEGMVARAPWEEKAAQSLGALRARTSRAVPVS